MWPESHTFTLGGFWNMGRPSFCSSIMETKDSEVDLKTCGRENTQRQIWTEADISDGRGQRDVCTPFQSQHTVKTCRNVHTRTLLPLFTVFKSKHTLQTWKAVLSQRTVTGKEVKSDELLYRGRQEQTTDANSRHPSRNFSPESAAMSAA